MDGKQTKSTITLHTGRNGEIELLRFVFAIIILLFHYNATRSNKVFLGVHGNIGVEFFFLVSGFLMAKTFSDRVADTNVNLANIAWAEVFKRIKKIFPYHILAMVLYIIHDFYYYWDAPGTLAKLLVRFIPDMFFLHCFGFLPLSRMGDEWYLSIYLIAVLILVPVILKYRDFFSKVIAPIIAFFMIGYIYTCGSKLSGVEIWCGPFLKSSLRGFAEIMLGIFCYEMSQYIRNTAKINKWTIPPRFVKAVEIVSFTLVIIYSNLKLISDEYEIFALLFLMVGITFTFAEVLPIRFLYTSRLVHFLGQLSLPLYLVHSPIIKWVNELFSESLSENERMVLVVLLSIGVSGLGKIVATARKNVKSKG